MTLFRARSSFYTSCNIRNLVKYIALEPTSPSFGLVEKEHKYCQNILLFQVVCAFCIISIEIIFRLIGYDFEAKKERLIKSYIYYHYSTFLDHDIFLGDPGFNP